MMRIKIIKMKTIEISPREFYLFKELAKFYYEFNVKFGIVSVVANVEQLEALGY